MKRAACSALVALMMGFSLTAQKPIAPPPVTQIPERSSELKSNQYAIAVKGCIRGKRLKNATTDGSTLPFDVLHASEFVLTGPRELLQQIEEQHGGHYDEIEGVVTLPPQPRGTSTSVTTKKLGPVRVGVGSREQSGTAVTDTPRALTLKVSSLTHLNEGCVERR
jgi:hypothetical protein